jgi:hypothetical protein
MAVSIGVIAEVRLIVAADVLSDSDPLNALTKVMGKSALVRIGRCWNHLRFLLLYIPCYYCNNIEDMAVPEYFILQAWEKAGGQCECRRMSHGHTYGRCTRRLTYANRGAQGPGGWAPRYRTSQGTGTPLSCEILCLDCYEQTQMDEFKHQT